MNTEKKTHLATKEYTSMVVIVGTILLDSSAVGISFSYFRDSEKRGLVKQNVVDQLVEDKSRNG